MSRTIIVNVTEAHGGLWPRVLKCFISRFNDARLPFKGERVVIEAPDGEVLRVGRVDKVNPVTREYQVRMW